MINNSIDLERQVKFILSLEFNTNKSPVSGNVAFLTTWDIWERWEQRLIEICDNNNLRIYSINFTELVCIVITKARICYN